MGPELRDPESRRRLLPALASLCQESKRIRPAQPPAPFAHSVQRLKPSTPISHGSSPKVPGPSPCAPSDSWTDTNRVRPRVSRVKGCLVFLGFEPRVSVRQGPRENHREGCRPDASLTVRVRDRAHRKSSPFEPGLSLRVTFFRPRCQRIDPEQVLSIPLDIPPAAKHTLLRGLRLSNRGWSGSCVSQGCWFGNPSGGEGSAVPGRRGPQGFGGWGQPFQHREHCIDEPGKSSGTPLVDGRRDHREPA